MFSHESLRLSEFRKDACATVWASLHASNYNSCGVDLRREGDGAQEFQIGIIEGHATGALIILGRIAGQSDDATRAELARDERDDIINRATGRH